jgi:hypothetical protein
MADKFTFNSAGEIQEVEFALARAGYTHQEVKELTKGDRLGLFRNVLLGHAEVKMLEYIIDLNADPFVPNGWGVEEHQKGGSFKWDPRQVQFYLSEPQGKEKSIEGNKLRKELEGKSVLNANVLDYLLAHPHLIPEDWKEDGKGRTRYIFFWGTIYRDSDGGLCVRCLYWGGGRWRWSLRWLDYVWDVSYPAALRAS